MQKAPEIALAAKTTPTTTVGPHSSSRESSLRKQEWNGGGVRPFSAEANDTSEISLFSIGWKKSKGANAEVNSTSKQCIRKSKGEYFHG